MAFEIRTQDWPKLIDELDRELAQLKNSYEQYFLGLERREPLMLREKVKGKVRKYTTTAIQNTGQKFRLSSLVARYNSLATLWDRQLADLEAGKSKRDLFKKKISEERGDDPPKTAGTHQQKSKPANPNDPMGILFQQYMQHRQHNAEPVQGITQAKLTETIQKQAKAIQQQFGCKSVTFKVVTENGKTKIKAIPKK